MFSVAPVAPRLWWHDTYMRIWQIFQAANIVKRPICSVYPWVGNPSVREDLHQTVYCTDGTLNHERKLHLM